MKSSEDEIKEGAEMKKTDHNVLLASIRHGSSREKILIRLDDSIERRTGRRQQQRRQRRATEQQMSVCASVFSR